MIVISESAWKAIDIQSKKTILKNPILRIGVKGGGCAGLSYHIDFEEFGDRGTDTQIFGPYNAKVCVDKKSLDYLRNATLIWEKNGIISESFKIKNDDVVTTCGCGTSFTIK
jgi:iron-sulfur cluster assembly protein